MAPNDLSPVGFVLAVAGSISGSVGLLFFKSSGLLEQQLPYFQRRRWWLGLFFHGVVSAIADAFAFSWCPLSLISPLAGLTIAFATVLTSTGCLGIKEPISRSETIAVSVVVLGVTLVSVSGPREMSNGDMHLLGKYLSNSAFIAFATIVTTMSAGWALVLLLPPLRALRPPEGSLLTTLFSAATAAACGAMTQLFLKVVAMKFELGIDGGDGPWSDPWAWFSVAACVLYALTQLFLLTVTMRSAKVALSVPAFSSLLILFTIWASAIFFGDFVGLPALRTAFFIIGVAMVGFGILAVAYLQARPYGIRMEDDTLLPGLSKS